MSKPTFSVNAYSALPECIEEMVHSVVDRESIIAVTDRLGRIVYANDRFCAISGYSRSELIGQNHRLLKSGVHSPLFYQELWSTILSGSTWRGEICNRAKDGRLYWVETVIAPVSEEETINYFISFRTEITAKKEAENALESQRRHSEEEGRLLELGRLADGTLHDLNNLLTDLSGIAAERDSELRNTLLQESLGRMIQLTRSLRDYSTGRSGEPMRFRLNPILSSACSLTRFRKGISKNLKITEDCRSTDGCEVVGYPSQIFEAMLNLLVNAVEACSGNLFPKIKVVTQLHDGDTAQILIEDNGPGVTREQRDRLFAPYASQKGDGRGLGLCKARGAALAHGGELRLVNAGGAGQGACFELDIPVETPVRLLRTSGSARSPRPGRTLLVADDDAFVRRMIETVATREGFDVVYPSSDDAFFNMARQMKDELAAVIINSSEIYSELGEVASLRRLAPRLPIILVSSTVRRTGAMETRWGQIIGMPMPFDTVTFAEALALIEGA